MRKAETTMRMYNTGALAIVRVETIERGLEITEGCLNGGIDVLEISYTLNNAGKVIEAIVSRFKKDICVGAGTVLDSETARHAILSGAQFIIAPNYDEGVAKMCNRYQIPYAPGCTSLTEAVNGLTMGASFIKAFPVSDFYGPKLCKVFKTPLPNMPILASGGITLANLHEWLENGVDVCGFGGLLTKGTKEEIAENAKAIREIISKYRNK
ncbi:ketohydroxyglutarate aldolase [Anaerorhabdus sp.]|uniref:ketohydroxyglutarate aldolase n=1 Tax=Anaerorhabdus sp. TaxID=1872524 RepID=UPI002FC85DBE